MINTASAPATFTVSPAGSGESDQTIMSIIGCDGFEITAPGVPGAQVFKHCGGLEPELPTQQQPEAVVEQAECPSTNIRTYSFTARFAPKVTQTLTCTGQIVMNNGTQTFRMDGTGVLPQFAIDVQPREVEFGTIRTMHPSDSSFVTLENVGQNDLDVTTAYTAVPELELIKGQLGSHKLPKGLSETFEIRCNPKLAIPYTGTLSISSNASEPKIDVPIRCQGIESKLEIGPTSFDIDTVVGRAKTDSVNLHNEGAADGVIKSVELGPDSDPGLRFTVRPNTNATLPGLGNQQIEIEFLPTEKVLRGTIGSVIVLFEEDAPRTIPILGEAKRAEVGTSPQTMVFGPVCANVPTTQSIDVFAGDNASYVVTAATTTAPFSVPPLADAQEILTGGFNKRLMVSVTPPAPAAEPVEITGTLTLVNDAPNQETFEVPMTAQPLPEGITTTTELSLGSAVLGEFTSAQPVKFTNCSAVPVMISEEPRILGLNASEFKLSKAFQPIMVGVAQTIEMDVVFFPKAPGQRVAELEIVYAGGVSTVALVGDGLGEVDGRDTYYACSTGGDAAWPIGFVVIAIARRRRRR